LPFTEIIIFIEKGSFIVNVLSDMEISIVTNTTLVECSNSAVLKINRVGLNTNSFYSKSVNIGKNVVNFSGCSDQFICTPSIQLPTGRRLPLPSFNCSTSKTIMHTLEVIWLYSCFH